MTDEEVNETFAAAGRMINEAFQQLADDLVGQRVEWEGRNLSLIHI